MGALQLLPCRVFCTANASSLSFWRLSIVKRREWFSFKAFSVLSSAAATLSHLSFRRAETASCRFFWISCALTSRYSNSPTRISSSDWRVPSSRSRSLGLLGTGCGLGEISQVDEVGRSVRSRVNRVGRESLLLQRDSCKTASTKKRGL